MQDTPVTFGHRGVAPQRPAVPVPRTADAARPQSAGWQGYPAPDTIIRRSLLQMVLLVLLMWVIIMFTAGSSKTGHDLPYWMRTGSSFHWLDFLVPAALCTLFSIAALCPVVFRPVALQFYDEHVEYTPILGAARRIRWSEIADIAVIGWGRYRRIRIDLRDGTSVTLSGGNLTIGRRDLVELLKTRRATSGAHLIGPIRGGIDPSYLLPGH